MSANSRRDLIVSSFNANQSSYIYRGFDFKKFFSDGSVRAARASLKGKPSLLLTSPHVQLMYDVNSAIAAPTDPIKGM